MNAGRALDALGLDQCSAADLAVVAKSSMRIFHVIAGKQLPAEVRPYFKMINFDECDGKLLSPVMRKPAFCICENKDADQLRGNREADQRLCFRYSDSKIPLLPTSEISSL